MIKGRLGLHAWRASILLTVIVVTATVNLYFARVNSGVRGRPASAVNRLEKITLDISGSHIRGSDSAAVVIVEYSDYECTFCRKSAETIFPNLDRDYVATGKLQYALVDVPLSIHKNAVHLAAMATCAGEQDKYWEAHRLLFQQDVAPTDSEFVSSLALNAHTFTHCVANEHVLDEISGSKMKGENAGVRATPQFMIGIRRKPGSSIIDVTTNIRGAQPYDIVKGAIDDVLKSIHK